jgi:hypothetical protein
LIQRLCLVGKNSSTMQVDSVPFILTASWSRFPADETWTAFGSMAVPGLSTRILLDSAHAAATDSLQKGPLEVTVHIVDYRQSLTNIFEDSIVPRSAGLQDCQTNCSLERQRFQLLL